MQLVCNNDREASIRTFHLQTIFNCDYRPAFPRLDFALRAAHPVQPFACFRPGLTKESGLNEVNREQASFAAANPGRSLREAHLAWPESKAVRSWRHGEAGSLEARTGQAQHLGVGRTRRLLEIRGATKAGRGEARVIRTEGQQFLCAAGKRRHHRGRLARRQSAAGERAPRPARGRGESASDKPSEKTCAMGFRSGFS